MHAPPQRSKLVVQLRTPNHAALQSLLHIAGAAGRAVCELQVWQSPSERYCGINGMWLYSLTTVFPALHTLHLSRVCGYLPPAARLPQLRHLSIHECPPDLIALAAAPAARVSLCQSIAAYLPQLHSLAISSECGTQAEWDDMWGHVFDRAAPNLTQFTTPFRLTDKLLRLLCLHAPKLEQLGVGSIDTFADTKHTEVKWGLKELGVSHAYGVSGQVVVSAAAFCRLPQSPAHGLCLVPARQVGLSVYVRVKDREVSDARCLCRTHMQIWRARRACACACWFRSEAKA